MQEKFLEIEQQLNAIVLGKKTEVRVVMLALIAGGHLLIEDNPGVGKTVLVQSLAKLVGLDCKRVQFTSDLLPSDIIGNMVLNLKNHDLEFRKGPLFTHIFLADELNRANPRTQSALLQAMEEGLVSIDGNDQQLRQPFMVIATQNPQTQIGTFPLPESQLDRFLLSVFLDYADSQSEMEIIVAPPTREKIAGLKAVLSDLDWRHAIQKCGQIKISNTVAKYIQSLLEDSRKNAQLSFSTRAGIALAQVARGRAYIEGRDYVSQDDVQAVASNVLGHRCASIEGVRKGHAAVKELVARTPVAV
jgi:MoxR-like ATPase